MFLVKHTALAGENPTYYCISLCSFRHSGDAGPMTRDYGMRDQCSSSLPPSFLLATRFLCLVPVNRLEDSTLTRHRQYPWVVATTATRVLTWGQAVLRAAGWTGGCPGGMHRSPFGSWCLWRQVNHAGEGEAGDEVGGAVLDFLFLRWATLAVRFAVGLSNCSVPDRT